MHSFDGLWVFVTGASSGIGLATARRLRQLGFQVLCTARSSESLELLRAEFGFSIFMEATDPSSVESAFLDAVRLSGGRLFGVFLNAGYGLPGFLEDVPRAALAHQLSVNVLATHQLMALSVKHMAQHADGRILINSSVLGVVAQPLRSSYVASKWALEGLADTLRLELVGTGIRVSLLEPGPVLTSFRSTARRALLSAVDIEHSRHRARYEPLLAKLANPGPVAPFTLSAEQCALIAARAFTDRSPKARYPVTLQARVLGPLKRLLPVSLMDRVASMF